MDSTGRDRGLSRISRLTRWSAAGALGLTGVFSVMVAHARPGASRAVSSGAGTPDTTEPTAVTDVPLQPPVQLPQPGLGRGAVTSGAS